MNPTPQRVALFGGSFDPIHLGHLEIAARAVAAMRLDRVIFLPCRISPHKLDGPPPTAGEDRLAMLRLATAGLPWAEVDDFDLTQPPPSYSYLTVAEMARRHPQAKLFWLLGKDQWEALPRWKHPEKLAAAVDFIVFSRDGDPQPRAGWTMHPVSGTHPASATRIRAQLTSGEETPWLPEAVRRYILDHGLYPPRQ
ncbi:MAG: nicotinate (nicotinamide) nucleotide adenylyltransferase [Akkermansiaceae bacterium]|jgi:nicotinate-nucleotide adenylyltransferase|nr:nicotinate (nicotinamide) nucleotide adenylyltransferase [Akkermansiaceae bacterium]